MPHRLPVSRKFHVKGAYHGSLTGYFPIGTHLFIHTYLTCICASFCVRLGFGWPLGRAELDLSVQS